MRTALLWNTFIGDLEWFKLSAKSFTKYARGWDVVRCIVPREDYKAFEPVCADHGINLWGLEAWPERGFNWHQLMHCKADDVFPDCEVIFHIDADTMFGQPCSPADWLPDGKILMPFTEYRHFLRSPVLMDEMQTFMGLTGKTIDFSRGQYNWKHAVDFALGFEAERECMGWMPMVHYRGVYSKVREIIAARFPDQGFDNYVFNARNTHPQSFCEFNTLGAVAHKFFADHYQWHDLSCGTYPFYGKVIQSWSGQKNLPFDQQIDRPHDYGPQIPDKAVNSPRKLMEYLGLMPGVSRYVPTPEEEARMTE